MTSMAASASQEHASPATRSPLSRPAINLVEHGQESYDDDDGDDNEDDADGTYEGGKYNYDSEDNGDNVEDDYDFTSSTDADKEDLLPNDGLGAGTAAGAAEENYFPRIEAIFYSIFHPTKGPSVIYQVPEGSIYTTPAPQQQQQPESTDDHANNGASAATAPSTATADAEEARTHTHTPLFDFKSLSEYIIPRAPLCGRLITYSTTSHGGQTYKIVSHPVLIVDQQKYPRNSFIFNLAFVFDGRADVRAYEPVVRKCARELKDLEQNSSFLSRSQFRMYEVIEQLFEDLNSYFESFVALPDAPHTKYVLEAAKATELLRDKRIFSPPSSSTAKMGQDAASHVAMGKRAASGAGAQQQQQRPGTGSSFGSATAKELTSLRLDGIAALLSDDDNDAAAISPRTTRPAPLRRASTDMTLMMTSTSPTSGTPSDSTPASPSSRKSDKRKDSAGSSAGGGGGVAMRPTVNRSKTFAALGISGTTVTTTNTSTGTLAASAATTTDDNESGVRRTSGNQLPFSAVSMSRTSSGAGRDGSTGATTIPRRSGGVGDGGEISVGAAAPAAMLAPGKREPPHGLGRTVRDAINVKLFPTYTNPKEVHDWDVPVTLLDLRPRVSDNWDLTMRKVLPFVDGINHVRRIAQLADADLELTRQCVEHLLYYRCIILIDTFQFTNLYTVRPTIATLAEDEMIINECASYVTRHGFAMPSWPKLLELYSSLRPSVTLNEWIEDNDIDGLGIDVRRFVTFGVIKGFLRRLHRFPVLLVGEAAEQLERMMAAANKGAAATSPAAAARDPSPLSMKVPGDRGNSGSRDRNRVAQMRAEEASMPSSSPSSSRRGRQETSDDQGWANVFAPSTAQTAASSSSRETAVGGHGSSKRQQQPTHGQLGVASQPRKTRGATVMDVANVAFDMADKDRAAEQAAAASKSSATPASTSTATRISIRTPTQRNMSSSTIRPGGQSRNDSSFDDDYRQSGGGGAAGGSSRGGGGGGVSVFSNFTAASPSSTIQVPAGFVDMLDGTYPDDAFCVRFGRNWNEILRILIYVGVQGGGGTTAAGQTASTTQLPASSSSATLNVRRGRLSTHDGGDGDGAGDESTFGHMSGIWGVGGGAGAGASAAPSRRRSSTQTQQAGTTAAAPAVTAFPSLPRFRQSSQNGTGQSTAGYSRYGAAASQQQQQQSDGGGGGGGGWSSRASTSVVMPLADDLGYDDRQRLKRGDLGRIQLIVK